MVCASIMKPIQDSLETEPMKIINPVLFVII